MEMDVDRDRRIRDLAYDLWEQAGRPDGGAEEYWYEAERRLAGEDGGLREEAEPFAGEPIGEPLPDPAPEAPAPAKPTRRGTAR